MGYAKVLKIVRDMPRKELIAMSYAAEHGGVERYCAIGAAMPSVRPYGGSAIALVIAGEVSGAEALRELNALGMSLDEAMHLQRYSDTCVKAWDLRGVGDESYLDAAYVYASQLRWRRVESWLADKVAAETTSDNA